MKLLQEKKLNNKGFTLIELLAVIVILAIVMGLSANSVINSINNSRKSTLFSTAQGAANSLNTWITEDSIVINDADKTLTTKFIKETQGSGKQNTWFCLNQFVNPTDDTSLEKKYVNYTGANSLTDVLGLSENDIVLVGKVPAKGTDNKYEVKEEQPNDDDNTCSALRYNSNTDSYEVLLVAKRNGKFFVSKDTKHFAFSNTTGVNELITD